MNANADAVEGETQALASGRPKQLPAWAFVFLAVQMVFIVSLGGLLYGVMTVR